MGKGSAALDRSHCWRNLVCRWIPVAPKSAKGPIAGSVDDNQPAIGCIQKMKDLSIISDELEGLKETVTELSKESDQYDYWNAPSDQIPSHVWQRLKLFEALSIHVCNEIEMRAALMVASDSVGEMSGINTPELVSKRQESAKAIQSAKQVFDLSYDTLSKFGGNPKVMKNLKERFQGSEEFLSLVQESPS